MLECIKIYIYIHIKLIALAHHHMVLAGQQPTQMLYEKELRI